MTMTPLVSVAILLAVGAAVLIGHDTGVVDDVLGTITGRGGRVGPHASPNGLGIIEEDPEALAAAAGLDLTTYALARMISSEEGTSALPYKVAVGWAAWNTFGPGVADGLLAGKGDADGHFKAQAYRWTSAPGVTSAAGAYASTAQDPHEDDVKIAQGIIGGTVPDPTGGATNFFRPGLQDKEYAAGKVSRDGATVLADWHAGGLSVVPVPGVADDLVFLRKGAT